MENNKPTYQQLEAEVNKLREEFITKKILEKENILLKTIFNQCDLILFSLDINYCYLSFNEKHFHTIKAIWNVEIAIGMNMLELISLQADREKAKIDFDKALAGESITSIDEYGDEKFLRSYYEDSYSPLKDSNGNIYGLFGSVKEITKLKVAEETLKESEEKFKRFFEEDLTGDFIMNEQGVLIDCNNSFLKIYGYSEKQEIIGQNITILYNDLAEFELTKAQLKTNKILENYEAIRKRKNGEIINIVENKIASFNLQGEIIEIKGYVYDITERKQSEQALKESEAKSKKLSNLTIEGIVLHNAGIVSDINLSISKIFGYTREEIIGKNAIKLLLKEEYHHLISQQIIKKHVIPYEVVGLRKDGTEVPLEIEGRAIELDGKPIRVTAVRDISERKKFQKELQNRNKELTIAKEKAEASEAKFEKLSNLTFEGIVLHHKGIAIDINLSFAQLFGYTPEEVIGENLFDLIIKEEYHNIVSQNIIKSYAHPYEVVGLRKDGTEFPLEIEARDFESDDKTIRVSAVRDISERKKFQKELQKQNKELKIAKEKAEVSEDKFRTMIETSPDGISIVSLDGTMQYVSPKVLAMWGYEHESEIIGKSMTDFFRSDYHEKAAQSIGGMFSGNFIGAEEYVMIRKDGSEFFGEANANLLHNEKDEPVSILLSQRDITNRKNAELKIIKQKEQLQELNTTKDKLFSIIAHDLRSPFNGILGFSELLIENVNKFETAKTEKYLGIINSSANNTLILLDNLLNWAKSQTGQISFHPEKIIFSDVILETIKLEKSIANAKNISLNYFSTDEIEVEVDENMLKTILRNLISNAIKFTKSGGYIRVFAISKQDRVEITVSDDGVGMNEETQNKLFSLDTNETTRGTANEKGSGLGLVLCKEFVEKLGGNIWVESELGKGSDFKFTLPSSK